MALTCVPGKARDARYEEMPDDNLQSQKYRGTGIPRYFVMLSTVDNFSKDSKNSKNDK